MTVPAAARPTNVRWLIIAMLMAFSFMNYFNRLSVAVAGDEIRSAYNLTETQFGTILSALILAYTFAMIPGGWLSDRIGGWRALALMGFGTATFTALTGLLPQFIAASQSMLMLSLLWVVRGTMGVFTAPLYPASGRIAARWIPFRQRATANALVTGAGMVGLAFAYPCFGALLRAANLTSAFLIIAVITAAIAAVWLFAGRDEPHQHPMVNEKERKWIEADREFQDDSASSKVVELTGNARATGVWRNLVRNQSLWWLTVSYATVGYVEYLVFYWSEHYFENVLKFSEAGSNLAAMVPPLCMAVCMPLGGWLSDRLVPAVGYRAGRATVAAAGMIGCASMLSLATITKDHWWIVACFALALAFIGITEGPAWATAIELGGRASASSASIANTGGNLGGALSPTLTPLISELLMDRWGYSQQESWAWAMRLACLICLVGAIIWVLIDASERSEEHAPR